MALTYIWDNVKEGLHNERFLRSDEWKEVQDCLKVELKACWSTLQGSYVVFVDQEDQNPLVLRVSKMRNFSLTELTAAKVSSTLKSTADVKVIIKQGLIPINLKDLLLKYM